jgi:hypothetical protein
VCCAQVDKFVASGLLVPVDDFSDSDYDYEESGEAWGLRFRVEG